MQLVHLLMADVVWLTLVLLTASALAVVPETVTTSATGRQSGGMANYETPLATPATH